MSTTATSAERLADAGRALRLARELGRRETWPPERLAAHRQARLDALVRHAAARSPYYRARLAGLPAHGPVRLADLPVLDKPAMMAHFDELVTDPRLRCDALLEHLDGLTHDALYLREYRAMTTSGSSGQKGLYIYDRAAWRVIIAQFFRFNAIAAIRPRLPRLRIASVGGGAPTHMSRRGAESVAIGLHRVLGLAVTMPLERIVAALNAFRPDYLTAFPSMAALLAAEQQAGRLHIAPATISTMSELRTPEVTARIEEAFGVRPFDLYATTEGLWGCDCPHHAGVHLFDDLTLVENVGDDGRPVPPGEPGARLLITNLFNLVQPLIRFEVSDVVTLDPEPCPCGRTLPRVRSLEGRADDVLHLPAAAGGRVAVLPLQFGVVTADRGVREFQVVQRGDRLRLRVALADDAPVAHTTGRLCDRVTARLRELGVADPRVDVETVAALERPPSGKLQIVVADRRAAPEPPRAPAPV